LLPHAYGLPQMAGGSASALSLSRPAQAVLTLRPTGSLSHPRRPLSRGSSSAGYPAKPLVSYQNNRQLSGWNPPPQVFRAFGAHSQQRTWFRAAPNVLPERAKRATIATTKSALKYLSFLQRTRAPTHHLRSRCEGFPGFAKDRPDGVTSMALITIPSSLSTVGTLRNTFYPGAVPGSGSILERWLSARPI